MLEIMGSRDHGSLREALRSYAILEDNQASPQTPSEEDAGVRSYEDICREMGQGKQAMSYPIFYQP